MNRSKYKCKNKSNETLMKNIYVCCYIYMQTVPPDAHQFIFQQGIVRSQSDVFLLFSPSHDRIATARSSGANLATLWLDLATFQTPSATLMSSRGFHGPAPVSEQSVAPWPSTSLGRNTLELWNESRMHKAIPRKSHFGLNLIFYHTFL